LSNWESTGKSKELFFRSAGSMWRVTVEAASGFCADFSVAVRRLWTLGVEFRLIAMRQANRLFQPKFAFPLASAALMAVAFLVYYYPVTARQEASLNRRGFRSLAAASESLQTRVGALKSVFTQAINIPPRTNAKGTTAGSRQDPKQAIKDYLAAQAPDFELVSADGECHTEHAGVRPLIDGANRYLEFICGTRSMRFPIERFVGKYLQGLPEQIFDDVVLATEQGDVLYQSARSGVRISKLPQRPPIAAAAAQPAGAGDAVKAPPAPSYGDSSRSSGLVFVDLAGEPYRLYLVPIVQLPSGQAGTPPPGSQLLLAGLLRVSRFRADSMIPPGTALVTMILLLLIVIAASWPLLKFTSMRATERVPRRSVLYFFVSTLATVIVVSMLALHLWYVFDLATVDRNLKTLAGAIERHFADEVGRALTVMESANKSRMFADALTKSMRPCQSSTSNNPELVPSSLLTLPGLRLTEYPYFDRIFWSDSSGHQRIKWDVSRTTTPAIVVADRPYFTETVAGHLWQFFEGPTAHERFRIDSVVSRITGEYTAVISQKAPPAALCGDTSLSVVSMVTPLISMIDPVTPPDYGFAVVDDAGNVVFHSIASRNGQEHFVDEVEDPTELRAALFSGQGKILTANYWGLNNRMFVSRLASIQPSPWSLIVFYDLSGAAQETVDRMILLAVLAFLYFAVIVPMLAATVHTRAGPATWIWPRPESRDTYLQLTLALGMITVLTYLLVLESPSITATMVTAVLAPILGFVVSWLKLRGMERHLWVAAASPALGVPLILSADGNTKWRLASILLCLCGAVLFLSLTRAKVAKRLARIWLPSLQTSYAALCVMMLTLASVVPAFAFFKVAFDYHDNLLTRAHQLETVAALTAREARVQAHYGTVEFAPASDPGRAGVARWLFLRRRLEASLDRYDGEFLKDGPGQIFSPATSRAPSATGASQCDDGIPRLLVRIASLVPFWNDAVSPTIGDSSASKYSWNWCLDGTSNRIRLMPMQDPLGMVETLPPTRALYKSVTEDPLFLHPEVVSELTTFKAWPWWVAVVVFLLSWFIVFLWMRPTIREMFLLRIPRVEPLPVLDLDQRTPLSSNVIVLTPQQAGPMTALRRRTDVRVVECADMVRDQATDWAQVTEPIVAIVGFDSQNDDEANRKKLEALERLLLQHSPKTVVIVSGIDPVFQFGAGSAIGGSSAAESQGTGHDVDRWARVFAGFGFRRTRLVPLEPSKATPEYRRAVWAACTAPERVALYQLAHDGLINSKNDAAIEQLQLRGLITGIPFRFVDKELRAFVLQTVGTIDRQTWVMLDMASTWDGIRLMFVVLLFGAGGALLFLNQQSVLGLVMTAVGVMTPITKLLSEMQSFRSLVGLSSRDK